MNLARPTHKKYYKIKINADTSYQPMPEKKSKYQWVIFISDFFKNIRNFNLELKEFLISE